MSETETTEIQLTNDSIQEYVGGEVMVHATGLPKWCCQLSQAEVTEEGVFKLDFSRRAHFDENKNVWVENQEEAPLGGLLQEYQVCEGSGDSLLIQKASISQTLQLFKPGASKINWDEVVTQQED